MTNFLVFIKYVTYIVSAELCILKNSCNFALHITICLTIQ